MVEMDSKPYFTICIPCYNREYILKRNLDSLINQSFRNFEVIIVDDGSTDNTEQLVNNYIETNLNIKYIYKSNGGKHSALNVGFEKANGIFFIILDSDDWLAGDALKILYSECKKIESNDLFSGVMGKWGDENGNVMGALFPNQLKHISYFDLHFGIGSKINFSDCFECNKVEILKKYRFPINENTKFVPEAYIFDQIGVRYEMICINNILGYKELLEDGLTKDVHLKEKYYVGFLYHYVSRIENVFSKRNPGIKWKIIAWWRYWELVKVDTLNKGPRVLKISMLGHAIKRICPLINIMYRMRYAELYKSGR